MATAAIAVQEDRNENSIPLQHLLSKCPPKINMQHQALEKVVSAPSEQHIFHPKSSSHSEQLFPEFMSQDVCKILPSLKEFKGIPFPHLLSTPKIPTTEGETWNGGGSHLIPSADAMDGLKESLTSLPIVTDGSPNSKRTHLNNKSSANDPLSHRIIEKRRRDRMNNCLADLSRLIPSYYLKKGRGRIEKTEIIEMAIKYLQHLQAHACNNIETCDVTAKQKNASTTLEYFQMGYQESMSETLTFLRDSEGLYSGDSLCVRIMNHLTKHCENLLKSEVCVNKSVSHGHSSSSSSSGYHANGSSSNGSSSDGNSTGSNQNVDSKEGLLTEESAYRSDERIGSDYQENISPKIANSFTSDSPHRVDNGSESVPIPTLDNSNTSSYLSSSGSSSSGDDNNGNRLYKFKSNMKHRFSVDSEHNQVKKKRRESGSSGGDSDRDKDCSMKRLSTCCPSSSQPGHYYYSSGHEDRLHYNPNGIPLSLPMIPSKKGFDDKKVPVFALHSSGTFYIPITVDYLTVASALEKVGETPPILHPISIFVNFCSPDKGQLHHNNNSFVCPLRKMNSDLVLNEPFYPNTTDHGKEMLGAMDNIYESQLPIESYNRFPQNSALKDQSYSTDIVKSPEKRTFLSHVDTTLSLKMRPHNFHKFSHYTNASMNNHSVVHDTFQKRGWRENSREINTRHHEDNQAAKDYYNRHSSQLAHRGPKSGLSKEVKPFYNNGTLYSY